MVERFGAAGIAREDISFANETDTFNYSGSPSEFVDTFRAVLRSHDERIRCCGEERKERSTTPVAGDVVRESE